jgi:hypothetical protein
LEIRQNRRRGVTWPKACVAAILVVLVLALMGWKALPILLTHPTGVDNTSVKAADTRLDRNAERQQQGLASRGGGPGGHIGDAP